MAFFKRELSPVERFESAHLARQDERRKLAGRLDLTEKLLAFSVKSTPDKAAAYDITGTFKFGVCDDKSCHPKLQPIAIHCAI